MIDSPIVKKIGWDNSLDDLLKNLLAQVLGGDAVGVLSGNDDGVDAKRNNSATVALVFDSDLGLGVGTKPWECACAACNSHSGVELVGQNDRQGHELLSFVGGVAEHDTLVTSTMVLEGAVIKTLGNVGGLLLDSDEDVAGLVIEALLGVIVTNLLNGFADDLLEVDDGLGGDLTEDHDHASLCGGLAGHLGTRVLSQARIELVDIAISATDEMELKNA